MGSENNKIFISYRRRETAYHAVSLGNKLYERFGEERVFIDIDSIEPGEEFPAVIEEALGECQVLVALIEKDWLTVVDEEGRRRLDDPGDFVRREISTALARNIRVIPVLFDGVDMPRKDDLPECLKPLARRNALKISQKHFNQDMERLIETLEKVLKKKKKLPVIVGAALLILLCGGVLWFSPGKPEVELRINQGEAFLNTGRIHEAGEEFRAAIGLDKSNDRAQRGLRIIELYESARGNEPLDVVEAKIRRFMDEYPDDPHGSLLLGDLKVNTNAEAAIREYEKATKRDPGLAEAWFALGYAHQKLGDAGKAIRMYEEAVRLSPSNSRYMDNLAYLYAKTDQLQKAIGVYKQTINADDNFLLPYCEIANAHLLAGDLKNARWYGEKLVRLLDDKAIATLPRNTEPWFFEVGENQVWLDGLPRKKYYALHGLAVTMFLLGKEAEAGQYARKANELIIGDDGEIKALILSDLVRLKGKMPSRKEDIERYMRDFLGLVLTSHGGFGYSEKIKSPIRPMSSLRCNSA